MEKFFSKYWLLILLTPGMATMVLVPAFIYRSFLEDYQEIDKSEVQDDVERAYRTFLERFNVLRSKVNDWGAWDEAFKFITSAETAADSEFIRANITENILDGLQISFVAFLDPELKPKGVWTYLDGKLSLDEADKYSFLSPSHPLIQNSSVEAAKDYVQLNGRPGLAVAKLVSLGDGSGPPAGRVVFVRLIDESLVRSLSEQTRLKVAVIPSNMPSMEMPVSKDQTKLTIVGGEIFFGKEHAVGRIPLISSVGDLIAVYSVESRRDVLAFGERSARKISIILACLLFALVFVLGLAFKIFGVKKSMASLLSANQMIKDRESQLQALIDSVPGYVSWFDSRLRYLGVNSKLAEDFGYQAKDFVGKDLGWNDAETAPNMREELKDFLRSNDVTRQLALEGVVGGEKRYFLVCLEKYRDGKAIVAVGIDTTRQHSAEQEAEKSRAMAAHASRLSALGEMAASIAHEINNPLAIISGTVRALPKFIDDRDKFNQRAELIETSIQRIVKIIKGLRKFSRTSDERTFEVKAVRDIVAEAIVLTEPRSNEADVDIRVDIATRACILCDEIEIEQVLVNLVNNAIDAVKSYQDRWVEVSAFDDADAVVVRVKDSGPGIPPEIKQKLFQPFFTTKIVGEGTGLGLSIVKGILEEHKARIELMESEKNTCFEIRFARADLLEDAA